MSTIKEIASYGHQFKAKYLLANGDPSDPSVRIDFPRILQNTGGYGPFLVEYWGGRVRWGLFGVGAAAAHAVG
jgi:hypothetical protein